MGFLFRRQNYFRLDFIFIFPSLSLWYICSVWILIWQENKAKMKIPKDFNKIPGSKILGNPCSQCSVIQFSFSFIFLYIKAIALIFLLQASHDVSFIPFESSGNTLCGGTFQFQPLFWIQVRIEEDGVN